MVVLIRVYHSFEDSRNPLDALSQGSSDLIIVLPLKSDLVEVVLGWFGARRGNSSKEVLLLIEEDNLQGALIRNKLAKRRPLRLRYASSRENRNVVIVVADDRHFNDTAALRRGEVELELTLSIAVCGAVESLPEALVVRKSHVGNQFRGHDESNLGNGYEDVRCLRFTDDEDQRYKSLHG